MRKMIVKLAAGALLVTLSACGGADSAEPGSATTTVRVAYTPIYSIGALQLGIDRGFFEDEGLHLELHQVANPPAGISAVAGGQVDMNYTPSIPLINAAANGVDVKVVAAADGYAEGTTAAVSADPGEGVGYDDTAVVVGGSSTISRPADLEGKTVSVPARGAQLEVTIADAVLSDGGDPSAIEWITLDFPNALSSLKSGRIDAAGLVSPFIGQATEDGASVILSPGVSFFGDGAIGLWVTSGQFAAEQNDAVAAFQRAVARSNAYANENVDDAQKAAARVLETDLSVVQAGARPYFPETVEPAALATTIEQMTSLGYLDENVQAEDLMAPPS
jgi:ABC-type nitrate/sulfonate/bicarbonate transport system substrate-binding protein